LPPSLDCDNGAVIWRLVAKARRPGVFTSKLIATRDVQVVSIPAETDVEITNVLIERIWDDQLHYLIETSKKVFAIGGSFHIKMSLMPLAKVQVHRLAVDLEGQELLYFLWPIQLKHCHFQSELITLPTPST
jgi:arrestin-related trafficking adapter 3/6